MNRWNNALRPVTRSRLRLFWGCCAYNGGTVRAVVQQPVPRGGKEHNMPREHWGGFGRHNKLYRICVAKNGSEAEESIAESHCPYDVFPVLGGGMQAETEQKSEGDA